MDARCDGSLERFEHRVIVPRAVIAEPVHEERRRASHTVVATALDVALDARAHGLGVEVEVALEARRIESDLGGESEENGSVTPPVRGERAGHTPSLRPPPTPRA